MGLDFAGNTVIRELTAGKDLKIVNRGKKPYNLRFRLDFKLR